MRIRNALLVPLLLTSLAACRLAAQPAAPHPARKALFWKASSDNNVTYLLGSIHFGAKSMYPLPKEIEDAFDRSAALAVEIDINRVDEQKTRAAILQLGLYTGGDTLWAHVGQDTRKLLEQFCTAYEIPAERLAMMKPWMVAVMSAAIPIMKSGMAPDLGIDKYFLDKVRGRKRVVEIESQDWQLKLLSGFPDEVQEQSLAAAMKASEKAVEVSKQLQDAWMAGDAAAFEKLIAEDSSGPPEVNKALLQDRNPHMADVAEQLLKGREVGFVMVGAAHLVGTDGVLAILEKRGYRVEQVALANNQISLNR